MDLDGRRHDPEAAAHDEGRAEVEMLVVDAEEDFVVARGQDAPDGDVVGALARRLVGNLGLEPDEARGGGADGEERAHPHWRRTVEDGARELFRGRHARR